MNKQLDLVGVTEAMKILDLAHDTIKSFVKKGELTPFYSKGRITLFERDYLVSMKHKLKKYKKYAVQITDFQFDNYNLTITLNNLVVISGIKIIKQDGQTFVKFPSSLGLIGQFYEVIEYQIITAYDEYLKTLEQ